MAGTVPAVEVSHLSKVYQTAFGKDKVVAVKDLSFQVKQGEIYGLIGPNGSGKSTTMKVVLGLIAATAGQTAVFGIDSNKVGSRRDVGFLPENPYFYKHLSGAETLRFYGKLCGLKRAGLKKRIPELLKLVDLEKAGNRSLGKYSKGMLQRIGLAQALVHDPGLIVLDEPTAGVDPAGSREIRDIVLELKKRGKSVLLTSHLLEQVQEVCDRVGIIYEGEMIREGTVSELTELEDHIEVVVQGGPADLEAQIRELTEKSGAEVIRSGRPRATLERLFLEATGERRDSRKGRKE